MANINSNLDYFDTQVEKNWLNYINLDGITKRYSAKEFYEEMQNDPSERVRAINLINSKVLSTLTIGSLFNGGFTNYFIICDPAYGIICDKCNSYGAIVLLLDQNLKSNFENKVFLPVGENYINFSPNLYSFILLHYPAIPVNYKTDYWYCPYCNELHRFEYDSDYGLMYDQDVVKF